MENNSKGTKTNPITEAAIPPLGEGVRGRTSGHKLLVTSRVLSSLFRPAYYPIVGFAILLVFTYMSLLPWAFKLWLLCMVYVFTIGLPWIGTQIIKHVNGWKQHELRAQGKRTAAYILNIICYLGCLTICRTMNLPSFMGALIAVSLLVQCCCTLINLKYKISIHSAGTGAIIGALFAYSLIFNFDPTWWLCGAILLSGAVMSSRMLLRQHSLGQVMSGTGVGLLCGFIGVILS